MSKHPLDAVSLVFGVVFGVMALAGAATLAGVVEDGLVVAVAGVVVAVAVAGMAVSIRRLTAETRAADETGPAEPEGPITL